MHNNHLLRAMRFVCGCMLLMPPMALAGPVRAGSPAETAAAANAAALPAAPATQAARSGASQVSASEANGSSATQGSATPAPGDEGKQTKRILGIVPNFRAVSANVKLPPDSPKEKFKTSF